MPYQTPDFKELGLIQQHGAILIRLTFLIDAAIIYAQLYLATRLLELPWRDRYVTLALVCVFVFGAVTSLRNFYRSWRMTRLRRELFQIFALLTISFMVLWIILTLETSWAESSRLLLVCWYWLSLGGIAFSRVALRLMLRYYRAGGRDHRSAAFIGATENTRQLREIFSQHPWMGIDVKGAYDDSADPADSREGLDGDIEDLRNLARQNRIGAIYITLPMSDEKRIKEIVDSFADTTASIYYCPTLSGFNLINARWDDVFGHPVVSIVASPFDGYGRYIRRLEDLTLSLLVLPVIIVPVIAIAALVKLTSRGPVFYLQTRYGLGGRPFKILKFRTMYTTDNDAQFVQAKANDPRITPLGAFLRRTSLDELPQFFSVLAGDMSVVGPRPAPVKYNEEHRQIIHRYMIRHKIKPGITGLAQINGFRGETETLMKTEMRTYYDLEYMANWSLRLDLYILYKTVVIVLGDFLPFTKLARREQQEKA